MQLSPVKFYISRIVAAVFFALAPLGSLAEVQEVAKEFSTGYRVVCDYQAPELKKNRLKFEVEVAKNQEVLFRSTWSEAFEFPSVKELIQGDIILKGEATITEKIDTKETSLFHTEITGRIVNISSQQNAPSGNNARWVRLLSAADTISAEIPLEVFGMTMHLMSFPVSVKISPPVVKEKSREPAVFLPSLQCQAKRYGSCRMKGTQKSCGIRVVEASNVR